MALRSYVAEGPSRTIRKNLMLFQAAFGMMDFLHQVNTLGRPGAVKNSGFASIGY
jgi:hypothetical protein